MDEKLAAKENEIGVLGSVMADPTQLDTLEMLKPSDFSWHSYGWAWRAILSLKEAGMGIDQITVGDSLEREDKLQEFSTDGSFGIYHGRAALSKLREFGEPRNALSYASNVLDYSAKRALDRMFTEGVNWSKNGRHAHDIIKDIQQRLDEVRTFNSKALTHTLSMKEAVEVASDKTDRASRGEIVYVPSGLIDLDNMLGGGFSAPDFILVAGRPGSGKTGLMTTIAVNSAKKGFNVAFFSLEMNNDQIAMRVIAMESGVDYIKQKSGKMEEKDWPLYHHGSSVASALPITLNDLPAISISQIRQELRRMKNIDLVIMDYIQLAGSDGKYKNREQEVSAISQGVKTLCKEFNLPAIAGAQLSRAAETRKSKRPILSDLRESGSLEQNSDIVTFIHRGDDNSTELIVAKHRNGPVGTIDLVFHPKKTSFVSATKRKVVFNDY